MLMCFVYICLVRNHLKTWKLADISSVVFWSSSHSQEFPRAHLWASPLFSSQTLILGSCFTSHIFPCCSDSSSILPLLSAPWHWWIWHMGAEEVSSPAEYSSIAFRSPLTRLSCFFSSAKTCARPSYQYWQDWSDLDNNVLCELMVCANYIFWVWLYSHITAPANPPEVYRLFHWPYILQTTLILSGRDGDSFPCSLFWFTCQSIHPSACSALHFLLSPVEEWLSHLS